MKKYKKQICMMTAVILLGTAAFSICRIYYHDSQLEKQEKIFEDMAEAVKQTEPQEDISEDTPIRQGDDVFAEYRELFLQNEHMVGWIKIEGTTVNYPVMQTPDNPYFYLKRNFARQYSDLGVPYIQENCNLINSDNLIVYGHHIRGGKMFGGLENYKSRSYYEQHKMIQFDTLTKRGEYEIIAVFKTVAYSAAGYRYFDFVDAKDEQDFDAYVEQSKKLALYDTGVTAQYGDKLITLSTCEYSANNGRLVVVAKQVA